MSVRQIKYYVIIELSNRGVTLFFKNCLLHKLLAQYCNNNYQVRPVTGISAHASLSKFLNYNLLYTHVYMYINIYIYI